MRLIRDGEKEGGGGKKEIIYLPLHCHHQNDSCIKMDKVTGQCPQTTTFEDEGEPKRIRTEAPPLASLTPCR